MTRAINKTVNRHNDFNQELIHRTKFSFFYSAWHGTIQRMNADLLHIKTAGETVFRFGRYETVRLLGKGAMGMVYLAHDPVLDRAIALKVIAVDPNLDLKTKADYFQRFSYEAKASAKLNHPSIVPVYDAGEDNGMPWIAFQFIEGETLEKMLKRRDRLPVSRAVAFTLDIAAALKHAHGWNIIHRDVKPSNILIETLSGIAKLADFGIVKAPWAPATQIGNTLGSPGYMSPEQIEGSELDQRADIFCLGVVLYQMICGKHPFLRDTLASTAFAACSGAFAPLSDLVDGVDPKLDWAVRACLAADKKKRIGSAQELIDILSSIPGNRLSESVKAPSAFATALCFPPLTLGAMRTASLKLVGEAQRTAQSAGHFATGVIKPAVSRLWFYARRFFSTGRAKTRLVQFFKKSPVLALGCLGGFCVAVAVVIIAGILDAQAPLPRPDSPEGLLMGQCEIGLNDNNRDMALAAAGKLSTLNPVFPEAHILIARTLIREGKFEAAEKTFSRAANCKGGKGAVKKELDAILDDVAGYLKKNTAPAALVELVVSTLGAGNHPKVRLWSTDTNYWLRWNAIKILKNADAVVDTVPVYILDLAFAGSVQTRLQAVRMLGRVGDKRSLTALKNARELGQNDPLVSAEASRVLEEKSR